MDGTLHLYTCSNCSTSVSKEFIEFIDRFKVEKLERGCWFVIGQIYETVLLKWFHGFIVLCWKSMRPLADPGSHKRPKPP